MNNIFKQMYTLKPTIELISYNEIFVDIIFENIIIDGYMISNYGRVYSKLSNKILKSAISSDGYEKVSLSTGTRDEYDNIVFSTKSVHRLVANAFCIKEREEQIHVNHIDSNRLNNRSYNLEWVTQLENNIHMRLNIQNKRLQDMNNISDNLIYNICDKLEEKMIGYKEIANDVGVDYNDTFCNILVLLRSNNIRWSNISINYNLPPIIDINDKDINIIHSICKLWEMGYNDKDICIELYGISPFDREATTKCYKLLNKIKSKSMYKYVSDNYNIPKPKSVKRYSKDEIHTICKMLSEGYQPAEIVKVVFDTEHSDTKTYHKYISLIDNILRGIAHTKIYELYKK